MFPASFGVFFRKRRLLKKTNVTLSDKLSFNASLANERSLKMFISTKRNISPKSRSLVSYDAMKFGIECLE